MKHRYRIIIDLHVEENAAHTIFYDLYHNVNKWDERSTIQLLDVWRTKLEKTIIEQTRLLEARTRP